MSKLTEEAAKFIRQTQRTAAKPKAQLSVETWLGRQLEDFEAIMFKDGNKNNLVPENILIGFKAGVPYQFLTCRHCGNRVIGLETDKPG
jgi:hypothetical protein